MRKDSVGTVVLVATILLFAQCVQGLRFRSTPPVHVSPQQFDSAVSQATVIRSDIANTFRPTPNFFSPEPFDYTATPAGGPSVMYICDKEGYTNQYCNHIWTKIAADELKIEKISDTQSWPSTLITTGATVSKSMLKIKGPDYTFFKSSLEDYSKICEKDCAGPIWNTNVSKSATAELEQTGFLRYTKGNQFLKVDGYGKSSRVSVDLKLSATEPNYVWGSGMIAYACLNSDGETWRYGTTMRAYANADYTDVTCVMQAFVVMDKGLESEPNTHFTTVSSPFFGMIVSPAVDAELATQILTRLVNIASD